MLEEKTNFKVHKIAVLITSFNRLEITKKCIDSLFNFNYNFDVYIVDDGSTDGTFEFISKNYPKIKLIKGDGNLFWNRGMNLAWEHASKKDYEYYLWLNDDVILYENAFDEIFKCSELNFNKAIISGVIERHDKSNIIYGGFDSNKNRIEPKGVMEPITFLNGNFVLIPKFIFDKVGFMDKIFHHDLGDVDYGLRTLKLNKKVLTSRVPIGSCDVNTICRVRLNNSTLKKRFKRLYSPLGSNPNINFYFKKKHIGVLKASVYYVFLIVLNIIPDKLNNFLFKQKYN